MEPESYLLITAAIFLIIDLIIVGRPKVKFKQSTYGFYACFLSFALIAIAYLSFLAGFLSSDFSLVQVYSYTSSSMPVIAKLYATWAGSAGSILLLILFTSTAWFFVRAVGYKKQNRKNFAASLIIGLIVLFFIVASVMMNPFARYGADGLIEGRGLNPSLQSVWMAIHPPIIFAGYTFIALAFALTLAKMKTGLKDYEFLFNTSVKAGWLFLTLGIGLGGLWAYEVLGWGGYWSWDPIETASLLPWVALTLYFISKSFPQTRKSLFGEFTILLAFSSLLFLSALTRGGLLQSVHAYGLSPAGPFILLFAGIMITYFFYLKKKTLTPLFAVELSKQVRFSFPVGLAIVCLFGVFAVCFSGIVYSMIAQATNANIAPLGAAFYNYANFPFIAGLLFAFVIYGSATNKRYIALLGIIAVCSITLTLTGWPTNNVLANLGLPLLIAALLAGIVNPLLAVRRHSPLAISRSLIHIGFVIILLGVFISSTSQQVTDLNDVKLGSTVQTSELTVTLTQCSGCTDNSSIMLTQGLFPQSSNLAVDTTIFDGDKLYNTQLTVHLYTAYGLVSQPTIIRTGFDDIYIHVNLTQQVYNALLNSLAGNSSQPEAFTVTIEKIPLINVIWVGVAMLIGGGVTSIASTLSHFKSVKKQQ